MTQDVKVTLRNTMDNTLGSNKYHFAHLTGSYNSYHTNLAAPGTLMDICNLCMFNNIPAFTITATQMLLIKSKTALH